MRGIDFSSWHNLLSTLLALALVTLVGVGLRLLAMATIQQRRERANRQINERLRVLIAAYKTLGGSFTGDLTVDPTHLRELHRRNSSVGGGALAGETDWGGFDGGNGGSERARRMRDAVEAAISDIMLLGTEEHVRLAERAASELVAGRRVHTHDLVVSLRDFIRKALDLDPVPSGLVIPRQGPTRPASQGPSSKGKGASQGDNERGSRNGGGGASGGVAAGLGMGGMAGMGLDGHGVAEEDPAESAGATKGHS